MKDFEEFEAMVASEENAAAEVPSRRRPWTTPRGFATTPKGSPRTPPCATRRP